jgi:hypothetical protein
MKAIYISTCCVLFAIAAGAVALAVHSNNQNTNLRSQWRAESKANEAKLAELDNAIESGKESITNLENNVSKLSDNLNKNAQELSAANDKIQTYEMAEQNRVAEERKKYLASVPQPTFDGKTYFFPKVVGTHDEILATNATFAYITGRSLIFRPEDQTQTAIPVDVDKVHPLILQYLGIDADAAKAKQEQIDAAWAAKSQADRTQAVLDAQAWEAKRIANAQLAIEQQKADAAQQAADAAQQQAQADKEKADAALLNAQKPPPQINVVQQSQQIQSVQQQPQPRGYTLINGFWVPYY